MIEIKFHPSAESISIFQNRGAQIVAALVAKMDETMIRLQAHVVTQKLSGQVLHRRTGILASSVRVVPTEVDGAVIRGAVEGAGGPAWYGRVHEYGGEKAFDILPSRAKILRFFADGQTVFARAVHREPLPARPFMEPSLNEMRDTIVAEIQDAFDRALKEP